jgi:hypothetical protein
VSGPLHCQRNTFTHRHTTLDERSARRRDFYLTTHDIHSIQTTVFPVGFEPTIPASERPTLRCVHTCTVTAYRNAITLQVTDTIRSYDLNFHPVPHDVTVSSERYTMGFTVCYRIQKHHECKQDERSGRWYVLRCTSRPAQAVTVSSL